MLKVKVGDKVLFMGNEGIATEVFENPEWDPMKRTWAKIHFTGDLAEFAQYQDKTYTGFKVLS